MPAVKTVFVCQECGSQSPKWQGKCPACDAWNTFVEEPQADTRFSAPRSVTSQPVLLSKVPAQTAPFPTLSEMDRVLGGGLMPGSLLLLGGAPGIGKSTLLLQVAGQVAKTKSALYVSGEESESQTKLRAQRVAIQSDKLHILHEISLESILRHLQSLKPELAVIDSIQTLYKEEISSAPGSVSQVRECAAELLRASKNLGITILLVGHITKDGTLAGPRVLEHIVDTVLYLEGESHQAYRILRAFKHRFGGTREVGIFQMTGTGMEGVKNPSGLFLDSRTEGSGSVVVPILEGQRPLLVELQALVTRSWYGIPKRTATGIDLNRVSILLAILEKRCRLSLGQSDVYANVTGALKIKEPAADLAMALAIVSSAKDIPVPLDWVIFGELGLGGEVRAVPYAEERLREAAQIGFKRGIVPRSNLANMTLPKSISVTEVTALQEAVQALLNPQ